MPYELPLPSRLTPWRVKIFDNERVEPPHVTIVNKRRTWRVDLRTLEFMDREPPRRDVPNDVMSQIRAAHAELTRQWDAKHPMNPVDSRSNQP